MWRPAPTAKTKELRGAGEGRSSGPPLRAGLLELGPAWVGEEKARVLSGMHLKQEEMAGSLRPGPH